VKSDAVYEATSPIVRGLAGRTLTPAVIVLLVESEATRDAFEPNWPDRMVAAHPSKSETQV